MTKEGTIRLGAGMSHDTVLRAISRLAPRARERVAEHKRELQRCKDAIHQAQWQLGVQKVFRTGMISHDEFLECIARLLSVSMLASNTVIKMRLGGNSLGISGSGHFCHLADDGSIVIPHNWR